MSATDQWISDNFNRFPMPVDVKQGMLDKAASIAEGLPRTGLPDGEVRAAVVNYWLHLGKRSKWHGVDCLKCFRTSLRLILAVDPASLGEVD